MKGAALGEYRVGPDRGKTLKVWMAGVRKNKKAVNYGWWQRRFLRRLAEVLSMRPLDAASCMALPGTSSVMFVAESHFYFECWPEVRAANLVVDCCCWFPSSLVTALCRAQLRPQRIESSEILAIREQYTWHDKDWVNGQKDKDLGVKDL